MIVQETVTQYAQRNVIRCDKCCVKIEGKERRDMEIVAFNRLDANNKVKMSKYHLCWRCAFNLQNDFDQRRERVRMGGVTEAEQEALLHGLFSEGKSRKWRKK